MNVAEGYNQWSAQYDTNQNKTRDLEAISLRETLAEIAFESCLEIGCGTGKNTEWLLTRGQKITAIDLSEQMLAIARTKISNTNATFLQADINQEWTFTKNPFDLVVCSLVLEHIADIDRIFKLIAQHLIESGTLYIGELHPFKQYSGTRANFENEQGKQTLTCFTHHVSDYTRLAAKYGLTLTELKEYFDDGNTTSIPRILTLKFIK